MTKYVASDGTTFTVSKMDLVFVTVKGQEPKPLGYNHYRAWSECWRHETGYARA